LSKMTTVLWEGKTLGFLDSARWSAHCVRAW